MQDEPSPSLEEGTCIVFLRCSASDFYTAVFLVHSSTVAKTNVTWNCNMVVDTTTVPAAAATTTTTTTRNLSKAHETHESL